MMLQRRQMTAVSLEVRRVLYGVALAVVAIALIALVVRWAPTWLASARGISPSERAAEIGRVRNSVLAILAGGIALVGAIYTARTFALNQQGQITERFSRAIEYLGHGEMDVRLGGIYALERIARQSAVDHAPIMEVLTAYLREHAPRLPCEMSRTHGNSGDTSENRRQIATDIQAAASVVARRRVEQDGSLRLNIRCANLGKADLSGADLSGADLTGTDLSGAQLTGTNLSKADLSGADLRGAVLAGADLGKAVLDRADLSGTKLIEADLSGAVLVDGVNLTGAVLLGADLRGTFLTEANFSEAVLDGADLRGAILTKTNFSSANLIEANLGGAVLSDANLSDANLSDAVLDGADLSGALEGLSQ